MYTFIYIYIVVDTTAGGGRQAADAGGQPGGRLRTDGHPGGRYATGGAYVRAYAVARERGDTEGAPPWRQGIRINTEVVT